MPYVWKHVTEAKYLEGYGHTSAFIHGEDVPHFDSVLEALKWEASQLPNYPIPDGFMLFSFEIVVNRVDQIELDDAIRELALSKLTDNERRVLGLTYMHTTERMTDE